MILSRYHPSHKAVQWFSSREQLKATQPKRFWRRSSFWRHFLSSITDESLSAYQCPHCCYLELFTCSLRYSGLADYTQASSKAEGFVKGWFVFQHVECITSLWCKCWRAALRPMPLVLFCWPTISEVDGGGVAAEVEPCQQYSIPFHYNVTGGSRGAVWQSGVWCGSAGEGKGWKWILLCGKIAPTDINWQLLNVYGHRTVSKVRQWGVHFSTDENA